MSYIDGFVLAVPDGNKEIYKQHALEAWPMFRDYGATRMVECWGDDVPEGEVTSFPMAVKCEADETVMFSWIEWPSRALRDKAMEKLHAEGPPEGMEMPFDGKRMIFGGFAPILDEGA